MALCDRFLRPLSLLEDKLLRRDRQISLERYALRAARAAACSDFRPTYKIVKSLAGSSLNPLQSVLPKDGYLLIEADLIWNHWRQHHAEVLSATIGSSRYCSVPVYRSTT